MNTVSRTSKTIKNSGVALGIYIINLILQFYSRKIFLDYLGTEILGLNTTANNLLQFLNLAELGINSAVGFTLYKPIHANDQDTINEIVTLQGKMYRRIALIVITGAIICMLFFPFIFEKIKLPLWYAYASYGALLFSSLLGYFINYRQIVLSASQQEYKIQYGYKAIILLKIIFQMWAVYHFRNGYIWWLILEVTFAIIGSISLNIVIRKSFPLLKEVKIKYKDLKKKYSEFITKIKQLFIHKISAFALSQLSPIILYAYTDLSMVALYGNYIIITTGIQALVLAVFNGMNAGIGNLVAEGNTDKISRVFSELFSIRFVLSISIIVSTYFLIQSFVSLWIGTEYLLPNSTVILLLCILFINIFRSNVESFTYAYGLYGDVAAAIIETIINIGCSAVLGYYYGLNGILTGVLISLLLVVVIWKPYYLFTRKMHNGILWYIKLYLKHLITATLSLSFSMFMIKLLRLNVALNWYELLTQGIIVVLLVSIPLLLGVLIINSSLRARIHTLVHRFR